MKLLEFFSKPIDISANQKDRDQKQAVKKDDLFWYILDHDKLYKDYFCPLAPKLKSLKEFSPEIIQDLFMPMVKKGCKEFYVNKKLNGKLGKVFPKDLREELCQKLYEHYKEGLEKNQYKLGM